MQIGDTVRSLDTGDIGTVQAVRYAVNGAGFITVIRAVFDMYSIEALASRFEPYTAPVNLADIWERGIT
jgi:hypothetical protein